MVDRGASEHDDEGVVNGECERNGQSDPYCDAVQAHGTVSGDPQIRIAQCHLPSPDGDTVCRTEGIVELPDVSESTHLPQRESHLFGHEDVLMRILGQGQTQSIAGLYDSTGGICKISDLEECQYSLLLQRDESTTYHCEEDQPVIQSEAFDNLDSHISTKGDSEQHEYGREEGGSQDLRIVGYGIQCRCPVPDPNHVGQQ